MPHIWIRSQEGCWETAPVPDAGVMLAPDPAQPVRPLARRAGASAAVVRGAADRGSWVLLADTARQRVRVNGEQVAGLRVLADRDEITLNAAVRLYFSTEEPVAVEPMESGKDDAPCPRCKGVVKAGTPSVKCPNPQCRVVYHQAPEQGLPCWTYAPRCAVCGHTTAMDAGYAWTPEEL